MCARGSSRLCLLSSSTRTPWRSCVGIRTMGPVCWIWQVGMELGTHWTRLGSWRATFPRKLLDFPSLAVAPTNWFLEVTSSQRWDSGDCHYSSSIPVSGSRTRVPFPCRSRDSRGARWQREEIKQVRWSHLTQSLVCWAWADSGRPPGAQSSCLRSGKRWQWGWPCHRGKLELLPEKGTRRKGWGLAQPPCSQAPREGETCCIYASLQQN